MSISFTNVDQHHMKSGRGKNLKNNGRIHNWGADQIRVFVVFQFSLTLLLVSISFIDKQGCFILLEFAILLKLFQLLFIMFR